MRATPANFNWDVASCNDDRNEARLGYLAAQASFPIEQVPKTFHPTDVIEWKGAAAFTAAAAALLDTQVAAIRAFAAQARKSGFDASGIPLHIEVKVTDLVHSPHDPIPAIPALDIIILEGN
jgi:hypothetical protein